MTDNEIIKFLQSKQIPQCGDKEYTADEEYEAYQRAIDALEQQTYDDAISRETLLTNLYQYKISCAGRIQAAILEVEELVEKMPPVTPQQKYGKWIRIDKDKCKCDQCEVISLIAMYPNGDANYCPNCGCRMVEPQESEV